MLTNPPHAIHRTRQVIGLASAVGRLAFRLPDPSTAFAGPLGAEKRAAWTEPIKLEEVKSIGKTFNSTVNDVLITVVAGTLGRYLDQRGEETRDLKIRGFIPVNLRPLNLGTELGNKFGLVFLSMPLGIEDPIERLGRIKARISSDE